MPAIEAVTRMTPPLITPSAMLLHGQRGVLHAEEHRTGQHGEGVIPVLDAGLGDRPESAADVEIGDVEPAEALLGLSDQRCNVGFIRHVAAHEGDVIAMAVRFGNRQRLRAVGFVEIGHHDLGAVGRKRGRGAAHAACPAGDDGHLARQSRHLDFALRCHGAVARLAGKPSVSRGHRETAG